MKYIQYRIEDFLTDSRFKKWVVDPNPDSDHFWQSFLRQYPEKTADVVKAKRIISGLNFPEPLVVEKFAHVDLEKLIEEVFEHSEIDINSESRRNNFGIYTLWNRFDWAIRAASVLLLALSAGIFWLLLFNSFKSTENDIMLAEIVKTAEKGQKLTIHLEDGTLVRLNSGSKLIYPEHFDLHRTIYLDGEAYFEVMEDPNRPFEVITQGIKTTVLGTKFGIKHDSGSKQIKVALLEGKVKVEVGEANERAREHILAPMEMVTFSVDSNQFEEDILDYNTFFGWKDDLLVFTNDGFSDVVKKLEDWYGIEFILHKQISDEKDFTGEYQNEILKNVLVGIGYTFDFQYELNNKTVIIK